MSHTRIDTHLHVWDLSRDGYPWLTPETGPLYRSFLIEEAENALSAAGVSGAILVQAEDSAAETEYLLQLAERSPYVVGVVGWVRLDDPNEAQRQLDTYGTHPLLHGIRHLVHDDPRDDFLTLPEIRASLELVAARGLAFDVPDAWPRHLRDVSRIADEHPDLTVVVDHLGKPPRGTDEMRPWEEALREAAARPNTHAKVSGLNRPGQPFTAEAIRPCFDVALEAFGPERLMYGSDWPVTPPGGHYDTQRRVFDELVSGLSAADERALRHRTAERVYRLDDHLDQHGEEVS